MDQDSLHGRGHGDRRPCWPRAQLRRPTRRPRRARRDRGDGGSRTNPEQLFAAGYAACFQSAPRSTWRCPDGSNTDRPAGWLAQVDPGPALRPVGGAHARRPTRAPARHATYGLSHPSPAGRPARPWWSWKIWLASSARKGSQLRSRSDGPTLGGGHRPGRERVRRPASSSWPTTRVATFATGCAGRLPRRCCARRRAGAGRAGPTGRRCLADGSTCASLSPWMARRWPKRPSCSSAASPT